MWKFCSYSPAETFAFGRVLGEFAPPGLCIALHGEMGAGKTLFAQGFAFGLGIEEAVTSPTFTVVNQYSAGRLPLAHMDLFRLADSDEAWERGIYEYFDGLTVTLVEWPQVLLADLPADRLELTLWRRIDDEGEEWHELELVPLGEHPWLKEALTHCESFSN